MRSGVVWAGLFGLVAVGCGAEPPQSEGTTEDTQPIAGGTFDASDHPAVFQEYTRWGSNGVSACTASLIADNVLLTARHCVAQGSTDHVMCGTSVFGNTVPGSSTVVTGDAVPGQASTYYRGVDVRVPSDSVDMCGYDIALIIIKTPISPLKVAPLVPRIDEPVNVGEKYVAVGYGLDEKGDPTAGRMERGDLGVRCLSDECQGQFGVAPTEFMGETGVCSGDSGGPALDDQGRIIGVVSRGSDPCSTPIYSQVPSWRDFIIQTVLEAAESGGYEPPFWAFSGSSALPEGVLYPGDPCTDSGECYPGTVCYYDSDPSAAACTPVCANTAQCGEGKECRLGFDVQGGGLCLDVPPAPEPAPMPDHPASTPPAHGADDGCALAPHRRAPFDASAAAGLAAGLALIAARRRRRP